MMGVENEIWFNTKTSWKILRLFEFVNFLCINFFFCNERVVVVKMLIVNDGRVLWFKMIW